MASEWYKEQPKNRNFLNPVGFLLKLEKFEGTDFFCQSANVPDISMPIIDVPTRFRSFPIAPGGGVTFGDFTVDFIIDEDLVNYTAIRNWMMLHGNAGEVGSSPPYEPEYTNAQLHILSSSMNGNHIIELKNVFPFTLTGLNFSATVNDVEYITASVSFKFQEIFFRDEGFATL
ncbi:tail tube monomer [Synechococcus phage ACG-2014h]|uniref:Tail tube monomer n=1 Tax=Synechococcus phage ACG-2014h TaxID=1340810 RepID=V5USA5_9CAUD|nr:tail tube monomer [Synechococcus phage ACG-2014h]AHB80533.1 tail tube monomer [Synechococcus phage ACG-2014h]